MARPNAGCKFRCVKCGGLFSANADLLKHQLTHDEEKPFHCEICGLTFSQKKYLRRHMLIH